MNNKKIFIVTSQIALLTIFLILITFSAYAAHTTTVIQPSDSNKLAGIVGVEWNVVDGNWVGGTHDVNVSIAISASAGAFTTYLIQDVNANTYCGGAANYADVNCTYTFNTNLQLDGNYFVDINMTTFSIAAPIDQNSVNDSSDANFQIDNSVAGLTISVPSSNQLFESTTYMSITFTYSTTDLDIVKYWVYADSETPIDNGTNTSYNFTTLVPGPHTLNVKSMDNLDNNSAVASVTINIVIAGGGGIYCGDTICNGTETSATCPIDCPAVCGDEACTHTESVNNCPADCGPADVCGNLICDSGENFYNCPNDCEQPPQDQPDNQPPGEEPTEPPTEPEETISCDELNCDDGNACTSDSCENARCLNIPKPDGKSCGIGMVCNQGNCVEGSVDVIPPAEGDNTGLMVGAGIVIVGIIAYFIFLKK